MFPTGNSGNEVGVSFMEWLLLTSSLILGAAGPLLIARILNGKARTRGDLRQSLEANIVPF